MNPILVDSSVILDVFTNDPVWADWSQSMLGQYSQSHSLAINPIIYCEVSVGFQRIEELEDAVKACGFQHLPLPREALFLAGKAFLSYRKRGGIRNSLLPDFLIGAHAAVAGMDLLTRDASRVQSNFPTVKIIAP